jgi:hypothetical protein
VGVRLLAKAAYGTIWSLVWALFAGWIAYRIYTAIAYGWIRTGGIYGRWYQYPGNEFSFLSDFFGLVIMFVFFSSILVLSIYFVFRAVRDRHTEGIARSFVGYYRGPSWFFWVNFIFFSSLFFVPRIIRELGGDASQTYWYWLLAAFVAGLVGVGFSRRMRARRR